MHPMMPFISEALWQKLPNVNGVARKESLVIESWPSQRAERIDAEAEAQMNALMELIGSIRNLRSEYAVPPATEIGIRISRAAPALTAALRAEERSLKRMARVSSIEAGNGQASAKGGAHAVLRSGGEVFIPLEGLIDVTKERDRLGKELARVEAQLRGTEGKLGNEQFVSKAKPEVIEREREKAGSLRQQQAQLAEKLKALE
jgi:valyl-tRNA synthetase